MFVLSRDVSAAKRVIATLLAIAVGMWTMGLYTTSAEAANITYVKDTLTDSSPGANSNHTIEFKIPSGLLATESIAITFPGTFSLTGVTEDDLDLEINGVDELTAAAPSGATWGAVVSGQTITFTSGSATTSSTATVTVKIGTNADGSGTGANQINNPATPLNGNQSYEIAISAGADNGYTRVVILNTVLVTAQALTTFDFAVYGLATSTAVNGTTTTGASSSTTLPYGVLAANVSELLGQDLTVRTNAANGFVVTVQSDGPFRSTTGADIDNFQNGTVVTAPTAWTAPTNNVSQENTWGHWGVTSNDTNTNGNRVSEFAANTFAGVTTTPVVLFAHNGPADGVTSGIGSTTVGYRAEITALQEAGDDYNTTLTYIATPTF